MLDELIGAVAQRAATAVADPGPTACSGLATRWSVLVSPSLNVPRRRLRCSADDSRALAGAAAAAFVAHDEPAQAEFLDHCTVCDDVAAFMLARRAILRQGHVLPPPWLRVQDHFTRLAGCA